MLLPCARLKHPILNMPLVFCSGPFFVVLVINMSTGLERYSLPRACATRRGGLRLSNVEEYRSPAFYQYFFTESPPLTNLEQERRLSSLARFRCDGSIWNPSS